MSDLRLDPINNRWVSIARNRGDRPVEFAPMEQARQQILCPFCKGNEEETPPLSAAYLPDGSRLDEKSDPSSWSTRVIPNRYPSFSEFVPTEFVPSKELKSDDESKEDSNHGPFQSNDMPGFQELIIPSPRHITSLSELEDDELFVSFQAYQDRLTHVQSLSWIKHAMLFMNCRPAAGATLGHVHSQLIGSTIVSDHLASCAHRNKEHIQKHGQSIVQSIAAWEIDQADRIVELTENFCVVCPFASRFAFQVWIIPRSSTFDLTKCDAPVREELATLCRTVVLRYETVQDDPAYNLLFHSPPFAMLDGEFNQSYFELFPRLTRAAGFEWGTDIWINPVSPESAARRLRDG